MQLYVWETDDSKILHYFDNQLTSEIPAELRGHLTETLGMLMKATDGLAVTADTPAAVVEVLDKLASRGMLHGPPWKLSDTGLERVQQCVALQNNRQLLEVCSGPLEEATLFQLIRHLDRLGWEHEVITQALEEDQICSCARTHGRKCLVHSCTC